MRRRLCEDRGNRWKLGCRKVPRPRGTCGYWELGEAREGSSPRGFAGSTALPTPWFWILAFNTVKEVSFYCPESPRLQSLVMAARRLRSRAEMHLSR